MPVMVSNRIITYYSDSTLVLLTLYNIYATYLLIKYK